MPPNLVMQTLAWLSCELERNSMRFAIAGGLALPVWNYPRSTQDIDLLLLASHEEPLLRLATQLGCQPRRQPMITDLGTVRVLQTVYTPVDEHVEIAIDFLLGASDFHRQTLARSIPFEFSELGRRIHVVNCEDLILLKLLSGRLVDLADCNRLFEVNRDALDLDHLQQWAQRLGVVDELAQVQA